MSKQISSREVTESVIARLKSVNPRINAVPVLLEQEALAAADAADAALARGIVLGPLHGVPVTSKSNTDQKGLPTPNGVVALSEKPVATEDSPPVAAMRGAGGVIIGRTNVPAYSLRWDTDNDLHGRTYNPHDRRLVPGGSSGGAAAAVAAGIGPIALGNDMGGSIRIPAHACGVVGIRPSMGRVPAFNSTAPVERPLGMQLLSVQGPLARTIGDLRLAMRALIVANPADPWHTPAPLEGADIGAPIKVAIAVDEVGDWTPEVSQAVETAAAILEKAGYVISRVKLPVVSEAVECFGTIMRSEVSEMILPALRKLGGDGINRTWDCRLPNYPEVDSLGYKKALSMRTRIARVWSRFTQEYPIVITPVSTQAQFEIGFDVISPEATGKAVHAMRYVNALGLTGLPVAAIPVGAWTPVPPAVQIISRRFREDLCLNAAEIIERALGEIAPVDPK
jgi:amidase